MWMNSYEIRNIADRFDAETQPNAERGARILLNLHAWTNNNSDGWAYWKKPSNAASRLMDALHESQEAYRRGVADELADVGVAELAAALRPIKAFLTRQKVDDKTREWIIDPDAAARKAAEAYVSAAAVKEEALQMEAVEYALRVLPGADVDSAVHGIVADAYLAGAKRS